jgi:hypothetical protein
MKKIVLLSVIFVLGTMAGGNEIPALFEIRINTQDRPRYMQSSFWHDVDANDIMSSVKKLINSSTTGDNKPLFDDASKFTIKIFDYSDPKKSIDITNNQSDQRTAKKVKIIATEPISSKPI